MAYKIDIFSGSVIFDRTSDKWRDPVSSYANLPLSGNILNEIRITSDTGIMYQWNGTIWVSITTGISGTSTKVEHFVLTPTDISNKYITLAMSPSMANSVVLILKEAPGQFYGDDYVVGGSQLSWNGKDLDGVLSSGDKLTIMYT